MGISVTLAEDLVRFAHRKGIVIGLVYGFLVGTAFNRFFTIERRDEV